MTNVIVDLEDFDMKKEKKAHSPFSASGAERWEECPGSVALSKDIPDKDTIWSIEGTRAHGVLERIMLSAIRQDGSHIEEVRVDRPGAFPREMIQHAVQAANFMLGLHERLQANLILVETRIYLDFIHPEMFGTFDGAVVDHFGTLHVFDFKYGAGHAVSAEDNMQMAFYGIGLAHKYGWNFKRIRLWIIQPRIRGYDGPTFWEIPTMELKTKWVDRFRRAVERVEREPHTYVEGSHCRWCKAQKVCPLKTEHRLEKAKSIFGSVTPVHTGEGDFYGVEEESNKSEADWRKEARERKRSKTKGAGSKEKATAGTAQSGGRRGDEADDAAGFF